MGGAGFCIKILFSFLEGCGLLVARISIGLAPVRLCEAGGVFTGQSREWWFDYFGLCRWAVCLRGGTWFWDVSFSRVCRLVLSAGHELGFDVYCAGGVCVLWSSGLATCWFPNVGVIVIGMRFSMERGRVGVFVCSYHCDSAGFGGVTSATGFYFFQDWSLWC